VKNHGYRGSASVLPWNSARHASDGSCVPSGAARASCGEEHALHRSAACDANWAPCRDTLPTQASASGLKSFHLAHAPGHIHPYGIYARLSLAGSSSTKRGQLCMLDEQ